MRQGADIREVYMHIRKFARRMKLPLTSACYGDLDDAAQGRYPRPYVGTRQTVRRMDEAADHETSGTHGVRNDGATIPMGAASARGRTELSMPARPPG